MHATATGTAGLHAAQAADLAIPKLAQGGAYFPDWLLERRKRAEWDVTTVVATWHLLGVSTRRTQVGGVRTLPHSVSHPGTTRHGDPTPRRRRRHLPRPHALIRLLGDVLADNMPLCFTATRTRCNLGAHSYVTLQHSGRLRLPRSRRQPGGLPIAELRTAEHIHWIDVPGGMGGVGDMGFWLVTKHADVKEVSRRSDVFSSWQSGVIPVWPQETTFENIELQRNGMLDIDAPHHTRLRKIISRGFTANRIGSSPVGSTASSMGRWITPTNAL